MDLLPGASRRLWPELRAVADLGFVLYGGTAVALRLGHRDSVDFDFFSEKPLDLDALMTALPFMGRAVTLQDQRDTWTALVPCGDSVREHVKFSFFGGLGFGRVGDPDWTDDGVLRIASLDDLMATKLKVMLHLAEAKDYRDVAALIRAGVSLARGLAAARLLYGPGFPPSESLKSLVFFHDGDLATLPETDRRVLIEAVSSVRDLPVVTRRSTTLGPGPRQRSTRAGCAK